MGKILGVELKGIMLYRRKTSVKFREGITSIIGDAGSGKSSLLQGTALALGLSRTLSPRKIRDYITQENQKPVVNRAYVEVSIDNSDGAFPFDEEVVTLRREIRLTDEGKLHMVYKVNGKRVTMNEYVQLIKQAGYEPILGLNVVFQHGITQIAADAEYRRELIEHIAGTARYEQEKQEALKNLQEAESKLGEIINDLNARREYVKELERQLNECLRKRLLQKELDRIELTLSLDEMEAWEREIKRIKAERRSLASRITSLKNRKGKLEARLERKKTELESVVQELLKLEKEIDALSGEKNQCELDVRLLSEKLQELKKKLSEISRLKEEREREISELDAELSRLKSELPQNVEELAQRIHRLTSKREELFRKEQELSLTIRALEEQKKRLEERIEHYGRIIERCSSIFEEIKSRQREYEEKIKAGKANVEDIEENVQILEAKLSEINDIISKLERAYLKYKAQREVLRKIVPRASSADFLEDMSSAGVLKGVIGRLSAYVKIHKRYEVPVKAALGDWLDALLVKDMRSAISCLEAIRKVGGGRVRIIPVKEFSLRVRKVPTIDFEGAIGPCTAFVACKRKDVRPVIRYLLANTVIVKNDEAALKARSLGFRAVTLDGDVYGPETVEGGKFESGSLLLPSREALSSLKETLKTLREKASLLKKHLEEQKKLLRQAQENLRKTKEEKAQLVFSLKAIRQVVESLSLTNLKRARSKLESELKSVTRKLEKVRSELARIQEKQKTIASRLEELRSLKEKAEALFIKKAELEVLFKNATTSLESLKKEEARVISEISRLEKDLKKRERELGFLEQRLSKMLASREKLRQSKRNIEEAISALQNELQSLAEEISALEKEDIRLQYEESKYSDRVADKKKLLRKYGELKPFEAKKEALLETKLIIEKELEEIGAVNERAVEDYPKVAKSFKIRSLRYNELLKEYEAIKRTIDEAERKKYEVFMETFTRVNEKFRQIFWEISGGGKGYLELENPDDPFEKGSGIRMIVQFPNSRVSIAVENASGCQRVLASLAFLIALKEVKRCPYYLLDEIEISLPSDVNPAVVKRVADVLKKYFSDTQLIIVTHSKEIASIAERVLGVYVPKRSVGSRVVAIDRELFERSVGGEEYAVAV